MQKYSRRVGFIIGNIGGLIGAGFSILGVIESHLIYFSIGLFLLGLLLVLHNNSVLPQLKKPHFFTSKSHWPSYERGIAAALIGPTLLLPPNDFLQNTRLQAVHHVSRHLCNRIYSIINCAIKENSENAIG